MPAPPRPTKYGRRLPGRPARRPGSFDGAPYIAGGTACLALGAGFVVYCVRRERLGP
ncbi:hypothetical protein SGRIM128S_08416 [Streptomyces griseomycini]